MLSALVAALAAAVLPIPDPLPTTLPHLQGAPATAHRMRATVAPRNPHLARDPRSNIHDDTWMTDAYRRRGPLGRSPRASSGLMTPALCGSLTFSSHGLLVSVCPSVGAPPQARVIDPATLELLASYEMPTAPDPPGTKAYQNFAGGGYFFLDGRDRIWSATKTGHVFVLKVAADGRSITKVGDYDLTGVLASDERISSALPDFKGRLWFVSKKNGKVGILNLHTRRVRVKRLGESVQNSFAVDRDAVYIVSDRRMYRFSARRGRPHVDWKARYDNSGIVKPGQAEAGSGTTPTIMKGGYVAITDNADPMQVVVYRKAARLHGKRRVVCEKRVFSRGASATENSLITAGRSLFVENNYGYQDPFGPRSGAVTTAGFARVDVRKRGRGCRVVWTNRDVRAPTVVPKLSTATGLIYTYTREPAPLGQQPYFWTAVDARTGRTAWRVYAGSGLGFNNNYAGIALGGDGTAYLGVTSGIVALRDG
jgi:outer membrane protein assembly factor BamB